MICSPSSLLSVLCYGTAHMYSVHTTEGDDAAVHLPVDLTVIAMAATHRTPGILDHIAAVVSRMAVEMVPP